MKVKKTWVSKEAVVSKEFIDMCSSDRVLAVLLKNRGIDTKEKIDAFLNLLSGYEILELARTGIAGLRRGSDGVIWIN